MYYLILFLTRWIIALCILIIEMQELDNEKKAVTEEEAMSWIKNNNKDINPSEWIRAKYYEKIGIERPSEEEHL